MGTLSDYASTRCPLFGEGKESTQSDVERFDIFTPIVVGKDDTGYDVTFYGATSGAYLRWDESVDALIFAGAATIALDNNYTDSNWIEGGTTASNCPVASSADRFIEVRWKNTATSGEMEVAYFRAYVAGDGLECYALTGWANVTTGTTHSTVVGTRGGVSFTGAVQVSGIAVGMEGFVFFPNRAVTGGSYFGGRSGIYADGSSCSGGTVAIHRFEMMGNSTGITAIGDYVFDFQGLSATQGEAATDETKYAYGLKCRVGNTNYWIMMASTAD